MVIFGGVYVEISDELVVLCGGLDFGGGLGGVVVVEGVYYY